ncbi:WD40/YVTN/BNR-like repeat-containing protein [Burkholderia sp. DN3021]|uniref:WD40/YVTN/BNR-like repeat-containing protein n=1 Tax=Burkholderia TaxID=32008 RepID=UPI001ABBDB56|nr:MULTISPECIES: hypothetical protein [Burkholderia cepacia complex]MDR6498855.1 hypothetical protein [Burkholderia ambifaria]
MNTQGSGMITDREYKNSLHGYYVTDCVVRNRDYFHFAVRNETEGEDASPLSEEKVSKKIVGFYLDEPLDKRMGSRGLTGFGMLHVGAAKLASGKDQVVAVDAGGQVYASGGGRSEVEAAIPVSKQGPRRGGIRRVRMIGGRLYAVGGYNTACVRADVNDWTSLCLNLPIPDPDNVDAVEDGSFADIDGFSHDDLYAVGGRGNAWRFNGSKWKRVPLPTNMLLTSVCCTPGGDVYIGAQSGTLFKGREDTWVMIHRGDMTLPFKDIVWHADQLWCTSDYGVWNVIDDKVVEVELPAEIKISAGNLSVADGMMLMAGVHGAAYHDGNEWRLIFNRFEMDERATR